MYTTVSYLILSLDQHCMVTLIHLSRNLQMRPGQADTSRQHCCLIPVVDTCWLLIKARPLIEESIKNKRVAEQNDRLGFRECGRLLGEDKDGGL